MDKINLPELIDRKALFVLNDSGGKDSQAMKITLRQIVPANQILIIHAHLPGVEHPGSWGHAMRYSGVLPFRVVQSQRKFLDMVEARGMFPSPDCRQCTSDLKRGPITKAIRHYIKDNKLNGLVVNCMGIRAEESGKRAKAIPFMFSKRNSKAGREWYRWYPIFDFTLQNVWDAIRKAGEVPHPIYAQGMTRLSCCFCIMANKNDLTISAKLYPELYRRYVELEKSLGFTMQPKAGLEEITGIRI